MGIGIVEPRRGVAWHGIWVRACVVQMLGTMISALLTRVVWGKGTRGNTSATLRRDK